MATVRYLVCVLGKYAEAATRSGLLSQSLNCWLLALANAWAPEPVGMTSHLPILAAHTRPDSGVRER